MPTAQPRSTVSRPVLLILLYLACLPGSLAVAHAAAAVPGPCEAGLVWQQPRILPAAYRLAQPPGTLVQLEWLGHSSFLLTSPDGVRLLTDPSAFHPPQVAPDLVTVSNQHMTHSAVRAVPGTPQFLWGLPPTGGWNDIALTFKDVVLFNVPSYSSQTEPESSPIQNSIFVMRTGGLCIVHLGNLRHPLLRPQLQRIGKPDVLLIPADGQWTLSPEDMLTVIAQLQPLLVIPMHFDNPQHGEVFVQFTAGRYAVRRVDGHSLTLGRHLLPATTEVVIFRGS
jgi:L-ascorbate metabolism protein UlaG (beta-lactamase superfamily)